jgi:tRNA acetyltransferase TAN1
MEQGVKRTAEDGGLSHNDKRQKVSGVYTGCIPKHSPDFFQTKKQWRTPRKQDAPGNLPRTISPGDCGIWATCNKGRERACVGELRDLFAEYAELLYGSGAVADREDGVGGVPPIGIENQINSEIADLQHPGSTQLFTPIRVDVQCGMWGAHVAVPLIY